MDLKFGELVILAESLLSQIHFDSLFSQGRVALLDKLLVEILKHRPLPF